MYILIFGRTVLTLLSPNWLLAWVMLEINILRFLPVICTNKINQEIEAATKYFLVQALGSVILLVGSTIIYQPKIRTVISIILITALFIKVGAFPGHFWYPSVIASISWINCMILSTWQKVAPLALLSVITREISSQVIIVLSGINAIVGGIFGINQTNLRSLLAYSSIGHLGWILAMIAINKTIVWVLYFTTYCILVIPVFYMIILTNRKTVYDLYNLHKLNYFIPVITSLLLLSLAGLPPLTGFLPKLLVVSVIIESNYFTLIFLLIGSYINLYYYISISLASIISISIYTTTKKHKIKLGIVTSVVLLSLSILGIITIIIYALITIY